MSVLYLVTIRRTAFIAVEVQGDTNADARRRVEAMGLDEALRDLPSQETAYSVRVVHVARRKEARKPTG